VTLKSRLMRLTQFGSDLCPECRNRRGRVALLVASRSPDGTILTENDAPTPCSRCGEVPEQLVQVVEEVVDVRLDAGEQPLGSVQ
jgi:hypothetical protein